MAGNLGAIVGKTRELDARIAEIAQASMEQSEGIRQLNSAVTSMDRITQENAAHAQHSADASEELKAQAGHVRNAVEELLRMTDGDRRPEADREPAGAAAVAMPAPGSRFAPADDRLTPGHGTNGKNGSNGHRAAGANGNGSHPPRARRGDAGLCFDDRH
jgi:methyl-accepting chemotaxis protein